MDASLIKTIQNLKAIVFDFDGVFTDNKVMISEIGEESVFCDRSDGFGLRLLFKLKMGVCILSTEKNPVVSTRAKKLQVACSQGCPNKKETLTQILELNHILPEEAAFVGNDVNDIEALEMVGLGVCVQDAYPEAIARAKLVLKKPGGHGAVRELCELVYKVKSDISLEDSAWSDSSWNGHLKNTVQMLLPNT